MWVLDSPYFAQWNSIDKWDVHDLSINIIVNLTWYTKEKSWIILDSYFDDFFQGADNFDSLTKFNYLRTKFDRSGVIKENPDLSDKMDSFCFLLRTNVALLIHPEKIEELAEILKAKGITTWKPSDLLWTKEQGGNRWLEQWFSKNCRNAEGEKDWEMINNQLQKIYPSDFLHHKKRAPFTIDSWIDLIRNRADELIEEYGYWSPNKIHELDSWLYDFLRKQKLFRKSAIRNDLLLKESKDVNFTDEVKKSRPNWFKIWVTMWEEYLSKLQLWNVLDERNEQEYRSFDDACEELEETISIILISQKNWTIKDLESKNLNLYSWFKKHVRSENSTWVDWNRIFNKCVDDIKDSYVGYKKI